MKLWLGKEKEGKYKGEDTLFVGDKSITADKIKEVAKYQKFTQIYFGAGCCTKINEDVIREIVKLFPKYKITIEIDYKDLSVISEDILHNYNINFIITITDKGFSRLTRLGRSRIQIKIQSLDIMLGERYLAVGQLEQFSETFLEELRGKTYKGDKVLLK